MTGLQGCLLCAQHGYLHTQIDLEPLLTRCKGRVMPLEATAESETWLLDHVSKDEDRSHSGARFGVPLVHTDACLSNGQLRN